MEIIVKIFTYGSLKKGFFNHHVVEDSRFIMKTTTEEKYDMVSFGLYPAVKESVKNKLIQGELYEVNVNILNRIDYIESNGYYYQRKLIMVNGYDHPVWMYFIINEAISDAVDNITDKHGIVSWSKQILAG